MKPDAFMPFYFRSFLEAIEGLPDWMAMGYLRSLCYNWGHRGCEGLKNDEESLRKICRIELNDWPQAWDTIFKGTEFWMLGGDGLWHQKFQDQLWAEVQKNYTAAVNGGKKRASFMHPSMRSEIAKKAANARWQNPSKNEIMLAPQALQQASSKHSRKH
jgi:uncharacterized protein YdaU (DUF1376 family)